RREAASHAAVFWFLGVYALPVIHNLDHRPDHTHGRPERHAAEHGHGHSHGDPSAPHHHDSAPSPPFPEEEPSPFAPGHGEGSLLHFAAAVVESQAFALPEPRSLVAPLFPPCERGAPSTPALFVSARGPPTV
ncbi:MAG: hypothetical protein ACRD21_04795, partial [Vicinamibacteria bacterium]